MVANATDFSTNEKHPEREPGKGFEPPTGRLQGGCSTSELPGRGAAGAAPHAGFASLSARSSLRLPLSARSGLAASTLSTLRTFGPRSQQEPFETSSPARSRDCNSASPAPASSIAESGARQGV